MCAGTFSAFGDDSVGGGWRTLPNEVLRNV